MYTPGFDFSPNRLKNQPPQMAGPLICHGLTAPHSSLHIKIPSISAGILDDTDEEAHERCNAYTLFQLVCPGSVLVSKRSAVGNYGIRRRHVPPHVELHICPRNTESCEGFMPERLLF